MKVDVPPKPRILVVEDDEDQRSLICEALSIHYSDPDGRNIVGVTNGQQCLAQDLSRFDVVLQDFKLPDIGGLELLKKILDRVDIPVLIVTGENSAGIAAETIQAGAQDYIVKLGDYLFAIPVLVEKSIRQHQIRQENRRLQEQLESMLDELKDKNLQLQESLEKLRTMAATDHLTGLANRRHFNETLERQYSEAIRYGFDLTCCMCDLDYYKQFNDNLGHQVGDRLLILTAEVIKNSLRSSDMAARYGGDEFVLLLPHTSVERGIAVGERMRQELVIESRKLVKLPVGVTMSIGVASLEADHPATADTLVAMADRALYVAKDRGKDRIVAFGRVRDRELRV